MKQIMILALLILSSCSAPGPIKWCQTYGESVHHETKLIDMGFAMGWKCFVRCEDEWIDTEHYIGCPFRVKQ